MSAVHLAMRDHPAATTVVTRAVLDARDQEIKVIGDARHSADRMRTVRRPGKHVSRDDKRSVSINVKGGSLCRRRNVRQHARGCRLDGKMHGAAIETDALVVVDPDGGSRQIRLAPASSSKGRSPSHITRYKVLGCSPWS